MKLNKAFTFLAVLFLVVATAQHKKDASLEKLIDSDQFDIAKELLKKRLKTFDKNTADDYIYYNAKAGFVYLRLGLLDSAMYYSKNAKRKLDFTSKKELKCESWKSIAYCFTKYGQLDSAIVYTRKLFVAVDGTKNYEMKRYANLLMGIIFFQNKLLNESLNYYEQALIFSKKAKKTTNFKVDYYNLGLTTTALKDYKSGIDYLTLAETYALKGSDKRLLARIYGTTADNYFNQDNDSKRAFYLEKANAIAKSINDNKLLAMGASHQLQWDIKNEKTDKVFKVGPKIIKKLEKQDLPQLNAFDDSLMYVIAKNKKKIDVALYYLESFTKNKLKLMKQNGRRQIEEIKAQYQLKNKNLTIEKLKVAQIASKRQNSIIFLVLLVTIITLFYVLYIYYNNRIIVRKLYYKEKKKDAQIKKLTERISGKNFKNEIAVKNTKHSIKFIENTGDNENKTAYLYEKIIKIIEEDKLFLKPDFDLNDLVKLVGSNKKYIYESISKNNDLNFRGLINRLRVNESKKIIQEMVLIKKAINFIYIYENSGFNSNSSFYRIFKTATGLTPSEYAIEFKKDTFNVNR